MTSEKYECVCSTCDTSEIVVGLSLAQQSFNEHAARGCEVVVRNVTITGTPAAPGSARAGLTDDESQPADE